MCERFPFDHRIIYYVLQNNILCINENLCPFVTSTESVTACVPIRSKK